MLDAAVAVTKIQPPRLRAELIARESLERRLGDALLERRLILLCAPAGFGKTAALTRQIERLPPGTALAWIGADEEDDLRRFLDGLFAALEPHDLPWRTDPDTVAAAAAEGGASRSRAANELLNALAACEAPRGLIVVDDAHRLHDAAVFEFLALLLDRLPPHWGLVVSSRLDPPLPLARLRAQGELAELRQPELSFTREEVASLIDASGTRIDAEQLHARTGGWPAGLRLSLNAHRPEAATPAARAMDRHVFDFLAAEVLEDMPVELREFLLRCAVLPTLSAGRCIRVSGDACAAARLAEIERRGLFVSVLDGPEPVLRLHDLFRDFLEERLRRERPQLVPELLRRAADSEPDPILRQSFLLRAGAVPEAEAALEDIATELLAAGAVDSVQRLVEAFPPERGAASPQLALVRGRIAWARWDWPAMAEEMRRAAAGFAGLGDAALRHKALVLEALALDGAGRIAESMERLAALPAQACSLEARVLVQALRVWHAMDGGELAQVAPRYAQLVELLEQTDSLRLWHQSLHRPLYIWTAGMREPMTRFVDGVLLRSGDAPAQIRAVAWCMRAWMALWHGDLEQALRCVMQAQDDARWLGQPLSLRLYINTVCAPLHAMRGEREPARAAISELLAALQDPSPGSARTASYFGHYLFLAIRIADSMGDAETLRALLARLPPPAQIANLGILRLRLGTLPARLASLDGRHAEACALWLRVVEDAPAVDIMGQAHEVRLRCAHALLLVGRRAEAAAMLRPVLQAVAQSGELGGVLFAGAAVLQRLAAAPWREELDWTELAMLRGWAQRYGGGVAAELPGAGSGPLSPRELDVLARIAAGDSNKLIARALELSPHTVKRHVANILDKLGVASRGEAARWYHTRP